MMLKLCSTVAWSIVFAAPAISQDLGADLVNCTVKERCEVGGSCQTGNAVEQDEKNLQFLGIVPSENVGNIEIVVIENAETYILTEISNNFTVLTWTDFDGGFRNSVNFSTSLLEGGVAEFFWFRWYDADPSFGTLALVMRGDCS